MQIRSILCKSPAEGGNIKCLRIRLALCSLLLIFCLCVSPVLSGDPDQLPLDTGHDDVIDDNELSAGIIEYMISKYSDDNPDLAVPPDLADAVYIYVNWDGMPKTVTDMIDRDVTFYQPVKSIVAIPKPAASLLYTIDGSWDRIAGVHPDAMKVIENGILGEIDPGYENISSNFVKSKFEPNVEEIVKLNPDVVIQWGDMGNDIHIKPIEETGIPTVGIVFGDFEATACLYGQILDKEDRANKLIDYHRQKREEIAEKTSIIPENEKLKVLNLCGCKKVNEYGILGFDWIELSGAVNVASELGTWGKTANMEQIITWNPDVIYIFPYDGFTPQTILNNEIEGQDWCSINAIKNRTVYAIPEGTHWWGPPSQEIPLMWEWLVEIQYPELFDYDMEQDLKDFYAEFYNYDLSDDQVHRILKYELNEGSAASC